MHLTLVRDVGHQPLEPRAIQQAAEPPKPALRCHNDQQLHFILDQAEARGETLEYAVQLEVGTPAEMVNFRDDQVSRRSLQDQVLPEIRLAAALRQQADFTIFP